MKKILFILICVVFIACKAGTIETKTYTVKGVIEKIHNDPITVNVADFHAVAKEESYTVWVSFIGKDSISYRAFITDDKKQYDKFRTGQEVTVKYSVLITAKESLSFSKLLNAELIQ